METPKQKAPAEKLLRNKRTITIGTEEVPPGQRRSIDLPVTDLYTHTKMSMPVEVINGRLAGPTLFVSAAIHGDEINGVEIVRRLLASKSMKQLRGTLIAIPIVNLLGFLSLSRYLPDRRDLNRSFPGSPRGSAAGRLAHIFCQQIVNQADCGIDLHTAAVHRTNLPQIRAMLDDEKTMELAMAFSAPVMINAAKREGSLRSYANSRGIPMLVYEAGEALRFDDVCIRGGVRGVQRVMRTLGMLPASKTKHKTVPVIAQDSAWVRASGSGIVRSLVRLGDRVAKGEVIAHISDPLGTAEAKVLSPHDGIVIGLAKLPLMHEGDAFCHIAEFEKTGTAEKTVARFRDDQERAAADFRDDQSQTGGSV